MKVGYHGKIIRVNLDSRKIEIDSFTETFARKFIGGSGFGSKFLFDETDSKTDPLGPENRLLFMTGPFCGSPIPTSGRHQVVAKSPLTNIFGESDVGGFWGESLKKNGYDGITIIGKADTPVYIWIKESNIEIRDALHLWGNDTYDTDALLRQETSDDIVTACIGPAGEKLVRFASIIHDGKDARPAGRTGMGAVMGSKQLKAIVVDKAKGTRLTVPAKLLNSVKEVTPDIRSRTKGLTDFGTAGAIVTIEKLGDLPIKNWLLGAWEEGANKLSGSVIAETMLVGRFHCASCPIACGRKVRILEGPYAPVDGAGPEYESLAGLGSLTLVNDLNALAYANELCNRYGMDTMSTGGAIAFAIEAHEKGLISPTDISGIDLNWGNADAVISMVNQIGRREGLGKLLGEGVKRTADELGGLATEYAIHGKGLELALHDPRAYNSVALSYATGNRGACHLQGWTYMLEKSLTLPELGYSDIQDRFGVAGKGEMTAKMQNLMSLVDSLKVCKFSLIGGVKPKHFIDWLNYITGWDISLDELLLAGERIYNLKRLYNVRCGISRKDDTLPPRILTHKRGEGGAATNLPPLGELLNQYYEYRGWSEEGIPNKTKLIQLDLEQEVMGIREVSQ